MKTLVNFDPTHDIRTLENWFERMFADPMPTYRSRAVTVPLDIYEREGFLYLKAAVPGVEPDEIDVQIQDNVLTIKGETKHEQESEEARVYRREYAYGSFSRSVRLPENLNLDAVNAEFKNGFLTISIPRVEPEKPKALKVDVKPAV
jgi:HSP20 family protein